MTQQTYDRFVLFPIRHKPAWEMYLLGKASNWGVDEIDLHDDLPHLNSLDDKEKHLLFTVLAFFAFSDGIVQEVVASQFFAHTDIPEERAFYAYQMDNEATHAHTYSLLISTYVPDPEEQMRLFNAVMHIPVVKAKGDWSLKWLDNNELPFTLRLVANACTEGIFFSPSFLFIFYFKARNLLPGLVYSNEKIAPDERLHTEFACLAFNERASPSVKEELYPQILAMIQEAVDIETEFVKYCLPEPILKDVPLHQETAVNYIRYVANWLLTMLGFPPFYTTSSPPDWMESIALGTKTNLHEFRDTNYSRTVVQKNTAFNLLEDF